jgi:hypothetical protein
MRLRIQRERDRRVSEHLGDELDMHALREQQRRRVPDVVKADLWQIGAPERRLERRRLVAQIKRCAEMVAEREAANLRLIVLRR